MRKITVLTAMVAFMVACSPMSKQAKRDLEKPVDCQTARMDIQSLKAEKASVAKQMAAGVQNVVPASAVVHLFLEQNYKEGWQVASGSYNRQIATKIEDIETSCGLS